MALLKPKLITIEEFEAFIAQSENADRLFELVDGEIEEKMPTEEHGVLTLRIGSKLLIFVEINDLGRVAVEVRYRNPDDPNNTRLPDVSFTSKERALPLVKKGSVPQMPDLAVEVQSPDDSLPKMRAKARYYLANGCKIVWLVLPSKRLVEVYRADETEDILTEADTLDGGDVLPGFILPVKAIFAD